MSATAGAPFSATVATFKDADPAGSRLRLHGEHRLGRRQHHGGDGQCRSRRGLRRRGLAHLRQQRCVSDHSHDQRRGRRHRDRHGQRERGQPATRAAYPPNDGSTTDRHKHDQRDVQRDGEPGRTPDGGALRIRAGPRGRHRADHLRLCDTRPAGGLGLRQPHRHGDGHRPVAERHLSLPRGGDQQRGQRPRRRSGPHYAGRSATTTAGARQVGQRDAGIRHRLHQAAARRHAGFAAPRRRARSPRSPRARGSSR